MSHPLISSLLILDPVLQFLTRASGVPTVSLKSLRSTLPGAKAQEALTSVPELARRGILSVKRREVAGSRDRGDADCSIEEFSAAFLGAVGDDDDLVLVGFPAPPGHFGGGDGTIDAGAETKTAKTASLAGISLHGSTKAAGKRRLAALKRSLKADAKAGKSRKRKGGNSESDQSERNGAKRAQQSDAEDDNAPIDAENNENGKVTPTITSRHKAASNSNPVGQARNLDGNHGSEEGEVRLALQSLAQMFNARKKEGMSLHKSEIGGKMNIDVPSQGVPNSADTDYATTSESDFMLPGQAAYAGSRPARSVRYGSLSVATRRRIPNPLADALGLDLAVEEDSSDEPSPRQRAYNFTTGRRKLYIHQSEAVESILNGRHTLVCTGTGSGKSLCFLLPIMVDIMSSDTDSSLEGNMSCSADAAAYSTDCAALIMFPTKALAQDQMSKLRTLVDSHPTLQRHIRPGVIDGDTPHPDRATIANSCNVILTNPDTLHAAILPGWKNYRSLLAKVRYVVIDESHTYEGAFGAHVALVLSRLVRLCAAALHTSKAPLALGMPKKRQTFVACSATMGHPEEHFRLLCPVGQEEVRVLTANDDGSPCSSKHFFVWNPTILDMSGNSTGRVVLPRTKEAAESQENARTDTTRKLTGIVGKQQVAKDASEEVSSRSGESIDAHEVREINTGQRPFTRRRHAADETARLLAEAVKSGVRCIAFCKTRSLVEWVFERCIANLRADPKSSHLLSMVESYRGGYSAEARRSIEARLFRNQLLGVVGTSALELGVDIGGIDLTLHCGYPGSISSLTQQSGRAGRGGMSKSSSIAIMICFASPSEQHLWRHPKSLLSRGLCAPPSVPLNAGIVQGHMLCGADEFPLMGRMSVIALLNDEISPTVMLSDHDLFGSKYVYNEVLCKLREKRLLCESKVSLRHNEIGSERSKMQVTIFSNHPSVVKPWTRVSMRSIEPISYSIVNLEHPLQGGKTDSISEKAVIDTIPYSRVFYHAYPGAVIMHRGQKFIVRYMNSPPPFADCTIGFTSRQSCTLGAFAKPTSVRYSTRALSLTHITVVKQFDRVELTPKLNGCKLDRQDSEQADDVDNDKRNESAAKGVASGITKMESDALYKSPELHLGSIAGNGVVTVKRTVHGYKKLSPVNRTELSRSELTMPSMEFDTNAIWFDVEANLLSPVMSDFDAGVHALSHAILAVAPLFAPCTSSDLDCDHTHKECTRVLLFDVRAGGAGTTSQLWTHFFRPDGVLSAAVDLLEHCSTCSEDSGYKGGCPGCLQSIPCLSFHEDLSRSAGLYIARRLMRRLEESDLYKQSCAAMVQKDREPETRILAKASTPSTPEKSSLESESTTPRWRARQRALHNAKDLESARVRNVVIGRPTWPMDEDGS